VDRVPSPSPSRRAARAPGAQCLALGLAPRYSTPVAICALKRSDTTHPHSVYAQGALRADHEGWVAQARRPSWTRRRYGLLGLAATAADPSATDPRALNVAEAFPPLADANRISVTGADRTQGRPDSRRGRGPRRRRRSRSATCRGSQGDVEPGVGDRAHHPEGAPGGIALRVALRVDQRQVATGSSNTCSHGASGVPVDTALTTSAIAVTTSSGRSQWMKWPVSSARAWMTSSPSAASLAC